MYEYEVACVVSLKLGRRSNLVSRVQSLLVPFDVSGDAGSDTVMKAALH